MILTRSVFANPFFELVDEETLSVSWDSTCGIQYGLFFSPDLENWSMIVKDRDGQELDEFKGVSRRK